MLAVFMRVCFSFDSLGRLQSQLGCDQADPSHSSIIGWKAHHNDWQPTDSFSSHNTVAKKRTRKLLEKTVAEFGSG